MNKGEVQSVMQMYVLAWIILNAIDKKDQKMLHLIIFSQCSIIRKINLFTQ